MSSSTGTFLGRHWDLLLAIAVAASVIASQYFPGQAQALLLAGATVFAWAPLNAALEWSWYWRLSWLSRTTRLMVRLAQLVLSFVLGVSAVWFIFPKPSSRMGEVAFLFALSGFPIFFLTLNVALREYLLRKASGRGKPGREPGGQRAKKSGGSTKKSQASNRVSRH